MPVSRAVSAVLRPLPQPHMVMMLWHSMHTCLHTQYTHSGTQQRARTLPVVAVAVLRLHHDRDLPFAEGALAWVLNVGAQEVAPAVAAALRAAARDCGRAVRQGAGEPRRRRLQSVQRLVAGGSMLWAMARCGRGARVAAGRRQAQLAGTRPANRSSAEHLPAVATVAQARSPNLATAIRSRSSS